MTTSTDTAPLARIAQLRDQITQHQTQITELRHERNTLARQAIADGHTVTEVAEVAGIHRVTLHEALRDR